MTDILQAVESDICENFTGEHMFWTEATNALNQKKVCSVFI